MFDTPDLKRIGPMGELAPEAMAYLLASCVGREALILLKHFRDNEVQFPQEPGCPMSPIPPLLSNNYRYGRGSPEW